MSVAWSESLRTGITVDDQSSLGGDGTWLTWRLFAFVFVIVSLDLLDSLKMRKNLTL